MALLSGGHSDFFGLDIGTTGLRAVQLRGSGPVKVLERYGEVSLDPSIASGETIADKQRFAHLLAQLVKQAGITTKNVAVNLPSNKVFSAIVDMDRLEPNELAKAIKYQAGSFIPTPLAKSKIDWAIVGDSPTDAEKVEILLTSTPNEVVEDRMEMLEAIGLDVIAIEPDSMALARSMIQPDATTPQMVLDIGNIVADVVIVMNGVPRLTRAIPLGTQALVRVASENLGVDPSQARQFIFKFGLGRDKLEGKIYSALAPSIENLMVELEKSIKFFQQRYNTPVERIIVTGGASAIPELPLYIANKFGISVEIGNAWRNVSVPADRQNELMAVSGHFAVAAGLAERVA